ncbi:GntR family transcriptional regulator [Salinibacterium sp. ZJ450]|uniref:GntR family transcriptional regulator n=1 Tax=Salinibacterium sp. ZJ450 TaxID=2708338 RepID=UPI001422B362|nr:GntR family transcriptional regulator [Salinibacterium sp. ZJ450]
MTQKDARTGLDGVVSYYDGRAKRGNTTDAVTDAVREAILDSVLPPGTWLREDAIAETLSVSRTPVREAIRRLADEGLVTRTSHQGSVVASISIEDLLAVYVVRQTLEGLAARLAAQRPTPDLLEQLTDANEQLKAAGVRGDAEGCKAANLLFHRRLRDYVANPYLQRFGTQLDHMIRRFHGTTFSQQGRSEEGAAEHDAIIAAIAARDPSAAEAAAKLHMKNARNIRLSMLID